MKEMEIQEFDKYIREIMDEDIIEIKCCSRLFHKNIVFLVSTFSDDYSVKFYYNGIDKNERFKNEIIMYLYFDYSKLIKTSTIVKSDMSNYGPILITKWVKGISLKEYLKEFKVEKSQIYINDYINKLEKIWNISNITLKNNLRNNKIIKKNSYTKEELIQIVNLKPNVDFSNVISIYKNMKKTKIPQNNVIGADISAHEFIISKDDNYMIDFEKFSIGNPNNDLARLFVSLASNIYKDKDDCVKLFSLFENNKYYKPDIFLYYLIEKVFNNILSAPNQINDEEINFYVDLINHFPNFKYPSLHK